MEAARQRTATRAPEHTPAPVIPVASAVGARVQLRAERVSSPSDASEKEAESTAAKVMRMEAPSIARFADTVQLLRGREVARLADGGAAPSAVTSDIASSGGSGSSLPESVRSYMEPRFGADFSAVRVHTGDGAASASRQLGAQAFTVGRDIYFGQGRFQPETSEGKALIAHELTHTIQQGTAIQRKADSDKRMYRTADGQLVELPSDITAEEAARLETEARAAEKKLGKGPPPKPVPDVKSLVPKVKKEAAKHAPGKKGRAGRGKGAGKVGSAAASALLAGAGTSKVAQYLVARAAPVLARGIGRLGDLKRNEQTHDDAGEKLRQSESAVVIPPSEEQSTSNSAQVGTVDSRPAPVADEKKAKSKLNQTLAANIPTSIEDVDNFKRDRKAQHMGADVMQVVQGDDHAVVSTFEDMRQTPPPTPTEHVTEALPPQEIAPPTPQMNLGQGAIAPLQKEHTDVSNYTKEADARLTEEGVTQEQLDMVDSGDLAAANKEKRGMEATAKSEPLAIQRFAAGAATTVDAQLRQQEKAGRDAVVAKRKQSLGATGQKQTATKTALEKKREEVAARVNGIYKAAQDKVKKRLAELETQSMKRFDDGNANATKRFEDDVKRELDAFKADRYSGFFGWARRAKDWLLGMEDLPRVKEIFETNRAIFVNTINQLVDSISDDHKRVIKECKDELTNAKKEIKEYVDKLGPGLTDIGKQAAEEMNGKLAELDELVNQKEEQLKNQLKDRQTAAIKAIDQKIEKMKEAMSGALSKLGKLLLYAAKKFFAWALEKFGVSLSTIESIIDKGVAVLKAIFTGPIRFVKNLINAASTGFLNFGKNFLTHLKNAVFEWLTGSLEGLTLPQSWDLKGIASVIFQMLGITWQNFRAHLVRLIPEPVVKALETGFELVKTLVTQGPMAAWEQLKEVAGEMKDAFVEAVKDWIKGKLVQKAIETVLAMFIPGAGIVRAIIGIYDTIVFFIQKAKDIMQMIGNFLGSISEIAAGNIGAAADALENGLARGLKLVIDFLARFLRLSGITAKIREAIQKVRGKVDGVLAKVAGWIVAQAKRLGKMVVQAGVPQDPKERLNLGIQAAVTAANRFAGKAVGAAVLTPLLGAIKVRYGFQTLEVIPQGGNWAVRGQINPTAIAGTRVIVRTEGGEQTSVTIVSPPKVLTFEFRRFTANQTVSHNEMSTGLQHHQNALNELTVERWLANIYWRPFLRGAIAAEERDIGRRDLLRQLRASVIEDAGAKGRVLTKSQIDKLVLLRARGTHASHAADAIAGGDIDDFDSLERGAVNSYIGSSWGRLRPELESYASHLRQQFDPSDREKVKMNFRLRPKFLN